MAVQPSPPVVDSTTRLGECYTSLLSGTCYYNYIHHLRDVNNFNSSGPIFYSSRDDLSVISRNPKQKSFLNSIIVLYL